MIVHGMCFAAMLNQRLGRLKAQLTAHTLAACTPLLGARRRLRSLILQHLAQHVLNFHFGRRLLGAAAFATAPTIRMLLVLHEIAMPASSQRRLELQMTKGAIIFGQTMFVLLVALQCHARSLGSSANLAAEATLVLVRGAARGHDSRMFRGEMPPQLQIVEKAGAALGAAQKTPLSNANGHRSIDRKEHFLVRVAQQMLPHLLVAVALELAVAAPESAAKSPGQLHMSRRAPMSLQVREKSNKSALVGCARLADTRQHLT